MKIFKNPPTPPPLCHEKMERKYNVKKKHQRFDGGAGGQLKDTELA